MGLGPGMQRARELGYTRSVGVSNFSAGEVEQVLAAATIPPVVNQVQFSPLHYRRALLEAGERLGVAIQAYSPLGTGRNLANKTIVRVAKRLGRTPAQVLLRWCLQHDVPVVTKSTHLDRIQENAEIFDFTLAKEDMAEVDALDKTHGTDRALERSWWS
jgi:diketogulonate reductase-like aldo/keto reductase